MITNAKPKIKVPDYLLEPMREYVEVAVRNIYSKKPDFLLLESLFKQCIYGNQEIGGNVDKEIFSHLKKMYQNPGEFFKCGTQIAEDVQKKYQAKMKKALKDALQVEFTVQQRTQQARPVISDETKNGLIQEQREIEKQIMDRFVAPPCRKSLQFPPYPLEKTTYCKSRLFLFENTEHEQIELKGISGPIDEIIIFTKVMKIEFMFKSANLAKQFELEMKKIDTEVSNKNSYFVDLKFEDLNHFLGFIEYFKNNNNWLGNLSEFEILYEIISHKFQKLDQNKSLHDVKFPLKPTHLSIRTHVIYGLLASARSDRFDSEIGEISFFEQRLVINSYNTLHTYKLKEYLSDVKSLNITKLSDWSLEINFSSKADYIQFIDYLRANNHWSNPEEFAKFKNRIMEA